MANKKAPKKISQKNGLRMALGGLTGLLVTMDISMWLRSHGAEHGHAPVWMGYPGFFLVVGFVGAALLAVVAKLILFPLLKRDEDYYAEKES